MITINGSGTTTTLTPSQSPVKITCGINSIAYVQPGSPYTIEGYGNGKAQIRPGSYAIFELNNNRIWRLIEGFLVVAPTPPAINFITSVGNTPTVNLAVTAQQLTASFASLLISQFTNDAGYIDLAALSAVAPLFYDNTTGEFEMTQADASTDGWLSSSDWSAFSAKEPALTKGNLTAAGTDGIAITGGTGAVIGSGTSIAQQKSDATHNGYLSSTDWSTFNSKGSGSVTSVATAGLISGGTITNAGTITTSMATNKLVGRGTASTGIMEEITIGTGLSLSSTTLNATGAVPLSINPQTASYGLLLADAYKLVTMTVGSANNLTVPLNSTQAFDVGTSIIIAQGGAGQTSIVATGGVTLNAPDGALKLRVQYSQCVLIKTATDTWLVCGDLTI